MGMEYEVLGPVNRRPCYARLRSRSGPGWITASSTVQLRAR